MPRRRCRHRLGVMAGLGGTPFHAARDDPMVRGSRLLVVLGVTLLTGACTASSPTHPAARESHPAASVSHTGGKNMSALASAGLLVPATYQAACASEGSICL